MQSLEKTKEELKDILENLVQALAMSRQYWTEDEITQLSNEVPQKVVEELYSRNKNFKYCAACTITKKTQSSLHVNSACIWNADRDCFISTQAENSLFFCIVNVFAVGI
ncbi:hypothetical protein SteCoe_25557 [Stentor coeruleus]|uniref:Dynein light chain n=1 Tax=Stentor coeruleus TaxID=5963 RepID=A0A1R2BEY4_9CILI|nr:hypothetical protein SteCoe_25557 [Stentor coeruleus]